MKELRCQTVDDMLRFNDLKKGVVRMYGLLYDEEVGELLRELAYIRENRQSQKQSLQVEIMSEGGEVNDSFALYDALRSFPHGAHILATGVCASAAVMIILQAATVRKATPNTRFLLHEPSAWMAGKKSSIEDEFNEVKRLADKVIDLLVERCGKTHEEVKALIERKEVWMSAEEALAWGLIDQIIE